MNTPSPSSLGFRSVATCLLAVLVAPGIASAQRVQAQEGGSQGFILDAGDHDIAEVIGRAAKFLGRNLIVQDSELTGNRSNTVTLQKSLNLDAIGCEEVVSQLAWLKGLVMSPVDPDRGIYEFINTHGQRRGEIQPTFMTPEAIARRSQLKVVVNTSLRLEHIDAMRASQYLRPMMGNNQRSGIALTIGSLGNKHALMLQGLMDQVANAIKLVSMMDTPDASEQADPALQERVAALEAARTKLLQELAEVRKRLDALEQKKNSE